MIEEKEMVQQLFELLEEGKIGQVLNLETLEHEWFTGEEALANIKANPEKYEIIKLPNKEYLT